MEGENERDIDIDIEREPRSTDINFMKYTNCILWIVHKDK